MRRVTAVDLRPGDVIAPFGKDPWRVVSAENDAFVPVVHVRVQSCQDERTASLVPFAGATFRLMHRPTTRNAEEATR